MPMCLNLDKTHVLTFYQWLHLGLGLFSIVNFSLTVVCVQLIYVVIAMGYGMVVLNAVAKHYANTILISLPLRSD